MSRRLATLAAVTALAAGSLLAGSARAGTGSPARVAPVVGAAAATSLQRTASDSPFTETKTIGRVFTNADGSTYRFPTHTVTVSVNKTKNLRGRQRVLVSWRGAQPSAARASNPYGENGLLQEYPVVILQCRGTDDPKLPVSRQVTPQTCWTGSVAERSQITKSDGEASWTHDLYAVAGDKQRLSGMRPFPAATTCPTADTAPYFTRLTPFRTTKGQVFSACDAQHMPPEAAIGAAFPPAELAAFTDVHGRGSVQFEVRSTVENESLGCSNTVPCSIEVIPIVGLSCDRPSSPATLSDAACRKGGQFAPGSSNFTSDGVDQAVSPSLWWAASNWRNRLSVPITFGLPPDTCDVLDPRAPTGFYGSELLSQAALQWAPAYCLDTSRFKFQMNVMSDDAGWNLMTSGEGPAAEVSSKHQPGTDPVGYAPTAVSGFSIGYTIDRPDNAGEFSSLKLDARLIAKLMTQSYLGSDLGRGHPGIGGNPLSLLTDPEFARLNPGLSHNDQEAAATLLSLSDSSDVISQLTDYIAHDKAAMAWVNGKADPWGMVVNPAYQGISLPTSEWPLLDTYVPKTENECRKKNPAVYFSQLAAPVTQMSTVAQALLDAWPNVQTRCDKDPATGLFKLGRIDRQSYGSRFMLGVVSLGDAARYGLRSAALETTPGRFVVPDASSLGAAVALAKQSEKLGPFVLDQAAVRSSGRAYPGTMIVYTAARTQHLDKADAAKVSQFIDVSTSEGQHPGSGNGQLPDGFLPITDSGVTKKLYDSARTVGAAVAAQQAPPAPAPTQGSAGPGGGGPVGAPVLPDTGGPVDVPPPASAPSAVPSAASAPPSATPTTTATVADMPPTQRVSSGLASGAVPALVLVGLAALVVSGVLRFLVRPPRRTS